MIANHFCVAISEVYIQAGDWTSESCVSKASNKVIFGYKTSFHTISRTDLRFYNSLFIDITHRFREMVGNFQILPLDCCITLIAQPIAVQCKLILSFITLFQSVQVSTTQFVSFNSSFIHQLLRYSLFECIYALSKINILDWCKI